MKTFKNLKKSSVFLLQSSAFVFLARLAGAGIGLLIQILLARTIGGEQLGIVYLSLAIANIGSVIAALGYPSVSVRFLRRYLAKGEQLGALIFRTSTRREVLLFSYLLVVLLFVGVGFLPLKDTGHSSLYWGILMIPAFALLSLNGGVANAYRRIDISYLPDVFIRPLFWLLFLSIAVGLGWSLQANEAVLTALLATLIALSIQFVWLRPILKPEIEKKTHQETLAKPALRKLWRWAALPMIAMTLLTSMIFDIDVLLLSLFLSNEDLALFGVAFKIAFLIGFGVHVTQQAALPLITDAFTLKQSKEMRSEILKCVILSSTVSLLSTVLLLLLGNWFLSFFGPEFVSAYVALILLSLCSLIRAVAGPATQMLVLAGKQKQILIIYSFGLFILAVFNFLLVPNFAIVGAALSLVVATFYWSVHLSITAFNTTQTRSDAFCLDILNYNNILKLSSLEKR